MLGLLEKPGALKEKGVRDRLKVTTEIIHRTGDRIRPVWQRNWLGMLLFRFMGLDIRYWPLGKNVQTLKTHNLITLVGHAAAAGRLSAQGGYLVFTTIAVGTGAIISGSDTCLATESTTGGAARHAATASQVTTTTTNDTTQLVLTITVTATLAITEEGIFDTTGAPTANIGNLLAKQNFAAINVSTGDTLTITHKYQC